jgi:3-oxoacyl-[acyl-carrier-protein] synthase-3
MLREFPPPVGRRLLSSYVRADGSGRALLEIPAGGTRRPVSIDTLEAREHYIRMNGKEVFRFAVNAIGEAARIALERAGLTPDDVSLIVLHQANIRIIDAATKRLGIPRDRWINNVQHYGNTCAGSIPLALNEAYEAGRVHEGDVILLVGFGGGLTWGAMVLRW